MIFVENSEKNWFFLYLSFRFGQVFKGFVLTPSGNLLNMFENVFVMPILIVVFDIIFLFIFSSVEDIGGKP